MYCFLTFCNLGVKEASERAILKLRSLQNAYVSAVRKATNNGGEHPDTTLFRSSDLLHPFLLATNYPNASPKLLDTSFKAMKTLMEANAICPGDGMNLVRVWKIQATVVVSYSNKESGKSGGINGKASNKSTIHSIDESISQSTSSNNSGSSWLPSFLSSSSSELPSNTTSRSFTTNAVSTKTAVSSSHGQAGSGHLNAKDLEKLALDILSCLLQLLELRDLPVSTEQWIQSVTLCCLLQQPLRQIVRQAANSTLPQVLTLLVRDKAALPLAIATWNDLLTCASGLSINPKHNRNSLQGAFSQCRLGERDAPLPPSPSLCLDLMTTLLKEAPSVFTQMGREKLGLVVQVLHNHSTNTSKTSPASPNEFLRILQFVLVVVQTQANEWPTECRELTLRLLAPIPLASEAIRKQDYFEDGYIYNTPNKLQKPSSTSSIPTIPSTSKDNTLDTLQKLPPTILWKAALCLETLKSMVQDRKLQIIWMHVDVLVNMLEAASDFCTIGASCQEHMHLLVLACRQHRSNDSLAHSAEALNAEKHLTKWQQGKHKDDTYVLGDALWVGLTLVLKMIEGLDETVLEQAFAPSLAVLQHYLKRFPASGTIVKRALEGYFSLAKLSLKLPLLRGALLTSLCKLSLPQWGTQDATCQLKDQNIAALICLINIIHRYYDDIGSEWSIVCQTFQELSVLTIASPHLSNSAYVGALSISAAYSRFASFSTCLSDESLVRFVEGLREVSLLEKTTTSNMITNPRIPDRQSQTTPDNERGTISEKLMNIGVRAIYGSNEGQEDEDVPLAERTKNTYFHDYQMEFSRRLATSKYPIRVHQVPFSFSLLADVAMTNSFRHSRCGATIFRQLCTLASESPSMKMFPMDTVAMLIMSHIRQDGGFPISFKGPGEIMYKDPRQNQYLAVETVKGSDGNNKDAVTQVDLLGPLCECIRDVKVASVAEAGVEALHSVLESSGHKLNVDAWTVVIQAVASLPDSDTRSSSEWSNSCLVGFRCLKLIVDDFVDHTDSSMEARTSLLDCCSSFGSSHHDVNTSLTAIGLLWTIADQDAGTAAIDVRFKKHSSCFGMRHPVI